MSSRPAASPAPAGEGALPPRPALCLTREETAAAVPGSDGARAGPAPRRPPLRGAGRGSGRSTAGPRKNRGGQAPPPAPRAYFQGRTCE